MQPPTAAKSPCSGQDDPAQQLHLCECPSERARCLLESEHAYRRDEIFTPTSPATYTYVERDRSIADRLQQALRTAGMQVLIFGTTGTGKSTFVRNTLLQLGPEPIVCHCTSETSFQEIVTSAITQLAPMYVDEQTTAKRRKISANAKALFHGFFGVGAEREQSDSVVSRPVVLHNQAQNSSGASWAKPEPHS